LLRHIKGQPIQALFNGKWYESLILSEEDEMGLYAVKERGKRMTTTWTVRKEELRPSVIDPSGSDLLNATFNDDELGECTILRTAKHEGHSVLWYQVAGSKQEEFSSVKEVRAWVKLSEAD
jgi:hypothetical protein